MHTTSKRKNNDHVKVMTMSRMNAIDRCYYLGKKFIGHFDSIYRNPHSLHTNTLCSEMQNWYNLVKNIILKENNMPLSKDCLIDWFFTATGNPDNFINNKTKQKINTYNNLKNNLLLNDKKKIMKNKIFEISLK